MAEAHSPGSETEAEARSAVALSPYDAALHHALGLALLQQAKYADARDSLRRAIELDPQRAAAHLYLAAVLEELGDMNAAMQEYRAAVVHDASLADAHYRLGVLHQLRHEPAEAEAAYRRAVALRPDLSEAANNLGTLLRLAHRWPEAAEWYRLAIAADPASAEALNNLANLLKYMDQPDAARACYDQALVLHPDDAQTHYNRAVLYLAGGDFARGWPEYEWRLRCPDFPAHRFARPQWNGEPLGDRRLLVHAEQGLGDTLQFCRYLEKLAGIERQMQFQVPPKLMPLLKSFGFANLVVEGSPLANFEVHVPLLSLPRIFGTTLATIPQNVPYLAADRQLVRAWRETLGNKTASRIGIVWQGREREDGFLVRSIPLAAFEPLARAGAELISLQKGPGGEQIAQVAGRFAVRDLGAAFDTTAGPFMDTAAVMESLDLIVTADTSIAHLAGAMARPVWLALSKIPEWRWLRDRDDSPWYPTMRLFRQKQSGDWNEVFERMAEELSAGERGA